MNPSKNKTLPLLSRAIACIALTLPIAAIKDEKNQGRWDKPCKNGPDAQVPGFLVNMGPTGARGILKSNSFVVKYIFPKTPAAKLLKLDDEVYGADGKKFATHSFGGKPNGIEGPIQDMGWAIEKAEASKDGILSLMVKRDGADLKIDIPLEKLGSFAESFSVDCKKTQILRERAYKYLMDNPDGVNCQGRCVANLSFLSSSDTKIQSHGKKLAKAWNKRDNDETWSWELAFHSIVLAEYHLQTKDKSVLPTLQHTMDQLRGCQWKAPNIICYTLEQFTKKNIKIDQETLQKHMDLYDGGFGHAPYTTVIVPRGGGGYGPMQWPTLLAIDAWQLGKKCGLETKHDGLESAFTFLDHGTTIAGNVAYGGEFTLNNGPIDSKKWKMGNRNGNSAKSGLAYAAFALSPPSAENNKAMKLHLSNIDAAYKDMTDGHADALMGFTWGMSGVLASDDKKLKEKVSQYYIPWLNMARCAGSDSYCILPARDYADQAYYQAPNIRNYTTSSVSYIYSFATPKLRIQGVAN
jgi:Family of unknown function (DUF6288)